MFVEGTARWQVAEDCPWDLLMALCLRELGGIEDAASPALPRVTPTPVRSDRAGVLHRTSRTLRVDHTVLVEQWGSWWSRIAPHRGWLPVSSLQPPHFGSLDRELDLQDLVLDCYADALAWTTERHAEYAAHNAHRLDVQTTDVTDVIWQREHELHRQTGSFHLDIAILPFAEKGAWVIAPGTVAMSQSFRDDSLAFRAWFEPFVAALV